jgi:hypothetical protein
MPEVFWFKVRNPNTGRMEVYPKKGVAGAIAQLGGEKLWGSIEEVDDDALDPQGFYEQPKGRLEDLTPQNLALVERLRIDIDNGRDWDRIDLTGHDLNRLLNAAREEAGTVTRSEESAVHPDIR